MASFYSVKVFETPIKTKGRSAGQVMADLANELVVLKRLAADFIGDQAVNVGHAGVNALVETRFDDPDGADEGRLTVTVRHSAPFNLDALKPAAPADPDPPAESWRDRPPLL